MDYCASANQISTYATSGCCCDPMVVKNIDCVTLEANNIDTTSLTVDGDLISDDITALEQKTQFQSANALTSTTSFSGIVSADTITVASGQVGVPAIVTNTIQPSGTTVNFNSDLVVTGTMTTGSQFTVSDTATTGASTTANFIQSALGAGSSTQIVVGRDDTNSYNSAEIGFQRPFSGTDNYGYFRLKGDTNTGIRAYSSYVHCPGELRIGSTPSTGVIVTPKLNGTVQNATQLAPVGTTISWTIPASWKNIRKIILMINGVKKKTNTAPILLYINGTSTYTGTTWGTQGASTQVWSSTGIATWNGPFPLSTTYTMNGVIEFSFMGTIGAKDTWSVSGQVSCPQNTTPSSTDYWSVITGIVQSAAGQFLTNLYLVLPTGDTTVVGDLDGQYNVLYY